MISISFVLTLMIGIQMPAQIPVHDEIKDALARAESLYYEARFNDAIQLLAPVNEILRNKPDRLQDRISANLQLALANIGLNDAASAKAFLREIYALEPDYSLDGQQFSPKVVALAGEAKTEQSQIRCQAASLDAEKKLASGDAVGIVNLLRTMKPKCAELSSVEPAAAELIYKKGLTEYKGGNFSGALQDFRTTLALAPQHEMAAQYLELTESKLQVSEDRTLLDWRKSFESHQYSQAATAYRQIAAGDESGKSETLNHVTAEYRNALTPYVESWTHSCSGNDVAKMREIETQVSALLPEPSFAGDLRAKMANCVAPSPTAETSKSIAKANPTATCLQTEQQIAMTRLKSRVEPVISREVTRLIDSHVTSRVTIRIDVNGNVSVLDTQGANASINSAVRDAVEHWKFSPAIDLSGPRCVDTEIAFVINK